MKIAVIGAGIAGLSVGQLLKDKHDVVLFEAAGRPGGLVKCDRVNGHLFHRTGGHVFNTRKTEVLDFFWHFFDQEKEFIKADRHSGVSMEDGSFVPYPIENHVYCLNDQIVQSFIADLIRIKATADIVSPKNFEEFLLGRFGKTLYDLYFEPYNRKVWRRDLTKVPLSWLEGKLPMPSVEEMLYNNIKRVEEKQFVHSTFFYPKEGGSQFVANRFAQGLNIRYNCPVVALEKLDTGQWSVDGATFDRVVYCGNIKTLPSIAPVFSDQERAMIEQLESHGTTSVLCEIDDNPYSWIYMPSMQHESHRIICTGNFSPTNRASGRMSATIEFTDYISEEDIKVNLSRIPWHPRYLKHHYEKFTYPIQTAETRAEIARLKSRLTTEGLFLCGRFAEWEYYNMDAAMASAIKLVNEF